MSDIHKRVAELYQFMKTELLPSSKIFGDQAMINNSSIGKMTTNGYEKSIRKIATSTASANGDFTTL
jgi:hypothetical protein